MRKLRSSSGLRSMPRVGLPSRKQLQRALDQIELLLGILVVAFGFLAQVVDALLEAVEIGQHQFGLDGLDVGQRRDLAFDMGDVGILEAAHHVRHRVDFANVGQKLVAEAFALRGTAHETSDVHERQLRRNDLQRTWRWRRACRGADQARPPRRHSARWCRTDSSPPAPPPFPSAR